METINETTRVLQLMVLLGMGAYAWWAVSRSFENLEESS